MIACCNLAGSRVRPLFTFPEVETTAAMFEPDKTPANTLMLAFLTYARSSKLMCMSSKRKTMMRSGSTDDCAAVSGEAGGAALSELPAAFASGPPHFSTVNSEIVRGLSLSKTWKFSCFRSPTVRPCLSRTTTGTNTRLTFTLSLRGTSSEFAGC